MPGFSCWDATACTLRDEDVAGSRPMPSLATALSFRRDSGASDEPVESILVGDAVSGESGTVLARERGRVRSRDSLISSGDSCWAVSSRTVSMVVVTV